MRRASRFALVLAMMVGSITTSGCNIQISISPGGMSAAMVPPMSGFPSLPPLSAPSLTPAQNPVTASFLPPSSPSQPQAPGPAGNLSGPVPEGERKALIDQALQLAGVPATPENESAVNTIVTKESNWNPRASNGWDSNARNGDPSRGLMQTIGSTFRANALPGYDQDIFDPLSNLIAGIRYAVNRYGSLQQVPGVASMASGGPYKPY